MSSPTMKFVVELLGLEQPIAGLLTMDRAQIHRGRRRQTILPL